MTAKAVGGTKPWRSVYRPEEDERLETDVRLSGLTKQDYIIRRLQSRDVVVQGNPRVYKALRNELTSVLAELQRVASDQPVDDELLAIIELIAMTMEGMKGSANELNK